MNLTNMTVSEFADVLASEAPAPGGGSAAALNGALGAGLAAMVCQLTIGKKKYEEHQDFVKQACADALDLKNRFVAAIDSDTEAFNGVSAVFKMPKETDEEKAARKEAMQKALKVCTISPFQMMEMAYQTLELVQSLIGKTNTNAASDLGCGALQLCSAVKGAWLNVLINIGGIDDSAFVEEYRSKGEEILKKAMPISEEIYNKTIEIL